MREVLSHDPSFPQVIPWLIPTLLLTYTAQLSPPTCFFSLLPSIFHNMALYYSFQCNKYLLNAYCRQRHCSEVVKGSQNAQVQGSSTYYLLDFGLAGQPLCLSFLLCTKRAKSLTYLKGSLNKLILAKHLGQGLECSKLR